jgi:hypothetical protein
LLIGRANFGGRKVTDAVACYIALFAPCEGETRIQGVARYADEYKEMGVEFTGMRTRDGARLQELLRRLNP